MRCIWDRQAMDEIPPTLPERRDPLLCRFGLHKARPSNIWNDGYYFSSCVRCDQSMLRTPEEKWHVVPRGLRVVWRPRTKDDIVWPTHIL